MLDICIFYETALQKRCGSGESTRQFVRLRVTARSAGAVPVLINVLHFLSFVATYAMTDASSEQSSACADGHVLYLRYLPRYLGMYRVRTAILEYLDILGGFRQTAPHPTTILILSAVQIHDPNSSRDTTTGNIAQHGRRARLRQDMRELPAR